jgi:hypothetical protein
LSSQWGDAYYKAIKEIAKPILLFALVLFIGWVLSSFMESLRFVGIILGIIGIAGIIFIIIKNRNWIPKNK